MNYFFGIDRVSDIYQLLTGKCDLADLRRMVTVDFSGKFQTEGVIDGLKVESYTLKKNLIWISEVIVLSYDANAEIAQVTFKYTNDRIFSQVEEAVNRSIRHISLWEMQENILLFKILGERWLLMLGKNVNQSGDFQVTFMNELIIGSV